MFLLNKYTKLYYTLVDHFSKLSKGADSEKHHIIPISLGGKNSPSNIVCIPSRVHFILHKLLVKMTTGKAKNKMVYALWRMMNPQTKNHKRNYRRNSRDYEQVRIAIVEYMKANNPMKNKKVLKKRIGVKRPEQSAVATTRNKSYWSSEENKIRKRERDRRRAIIANRKVVLYDLQTNQAYYYWLVIEAIEAHGLPYSVQNSLYSGTPYKGRYLLKWCEG